MERSAIMRAVRSKDTMPEMKVRRFLHGMGFRFRLHRADLPGRPDLVFVSRRKVIFVNGCYWHGHACARGNRIPKTNTGYWKSKISRNVLRDKANLSALAAKGWNSLTIWECELLDINRLRSRLEHFLEG